MSCPLCGDSTQKKKKARGYIYEHKNKMMYKCHKCGASMTFGSFLEKIDEVMFREYRNEKLESKYSLNRRVAPQKVDDDTKEQEKRVVVNSNALKSRLVPFDAMRPELRTYLEARQIPKFALDKYFYYTKTFNAFTNWLLPGKFSKDAVEEERIIILMHDINDDIFAYQGREIQQSYAKYVTIKLDDSQQKIFGRDRIDMTKDVFVFEGPIDSMFVDNAVGCCGSDLVTATSSLDATKIYVFDNEPRSPAIVAKMKRTIEEGHRIVIWPSHVKSGWDVNDMVLSDIDVNATVRANTYSGIRATINFNTWKKI